MPAAALDPIYDYDPAYLADILKSVKTIAMVGASADKTKFSYGVLRVLHETGYDMIPVNPNPALTEIRGIKVYHTLEEIDRFLQDESPDAYEKLLDRLLARDEFGERMASGWLDAARSMS